MEKRNPPQASSLEPTSFPSFECSLCRITDRSLYNYICKACKFTVFFPSKVHTACKMQTGYWQYMFTMCCWDLSVSSGIIFKGPVWWLFSISWNSLLKENRQKKSVLDISLNYDPIHFLDSLKKKNSNIGGFEFIQSFFLFNNNKKMYW